ncbi:LysM peptidoglycan-binding domain-containing protein [Neisseria mucosa]|uniref:LysM peptidoglycan-binding domain-containing protein n=1 Tax=Neisseria mucosa TaxID=488 RepID=UPI000D33DB96|nr:LysM peptidoglycan-binding domain-containing protein [Neisseria mucosa]
MAKLKTIALTLSGLSAVSGAAAAQNATPNQTGMAMMRLNSALLDQAKAKTFGSGSLWASLKKDFRMSEVNSELVRRHESKFAANGAYFDRTITRSKPYMYHIATEVKKRNMPAEIALLPFIESAFVTKAKSHVGASGLWQFMPATGRHFGLEKTPLYDGRHDVYAATDAALNYLQYLHGLFNDWSLALAAYNWGEGNVGRAVNRARAQGLEPTYENLRMPNETRNYVPKLLAVRNIVASPQTFGMNISEITNQPYFQTVSIDKPIDNSTIARLANISESELLTLNPAFNAPVFIPKNNRKLLLPVSAVSAFEKNYRNANPETLLSFNAYTSARNTNLNTIATETGMSVAEIKRLNGLNGNSLSEGRTILVAQTDTATKQDMINFIDTDNTPDTYRSNMPTMAPIQTAELKTDTVKKVVAPANTVAQEPAPTTFDFVANTKAATAPIAADAVTTAQPRVERVQTVQSTEAKPATDTTVIAAAEPAQPALTLTEPQVVASAKSATPSAPSAVEEPDQMMALLANVDSRLQKEEEDQIIVTQNIAHHQEVDAAKARSERIAENIAKHQSRTEARLARANNQSSAQPTTMAGMHRVADGDTLFNISKRYNLSVADLIVTNNIKGSNIRKGQLLRVSADPVKTRKNNIQNVSYTVRRGDTLNTIADRFNIDVNDIRRWNKNTRTVTPGQRLKLMGS